MASIAGMGSLLFSMVSTTINSVALLLTSGPTPSCYSSLVIPSAESSCILVQAETVFILRESTTNTLHSILPGCLLWFFTVSRMTSFIIPGQIHQFPSLFRSRSTVIISIICKHCCVWPALTSHMITSGDGFGKYSFQVTDTEVL